MMVAMAVEREELSYETKIAGRSIPSVHARWEDALTAHQRAKTVRFQGGKLTGEVFTNSVLMHFLSLDFEEQGRILTEFVPQFEERVELRGNRKTPAEPTTGRDQPMTASRPVRANREPKRRRGTG